MRALVFAIVAVASGCTVDGTPSGARKTGLVRLFQHAEGGGIISAQFGDDPCTTQVAGPCDVVFCPPAGADAGATSSSPSAGKITEDGLLQPVTLLVNPDGTYYPQPAGHLWNNRAERAAIHADGAAIPTFDGAVLAPAQGFFRAPVPVAPTPQQPNGPTIDRAADFTFSWQGTDPVHAIISSGNARVDCPFDGNPGSGAIPATALSLLPAGPARFDAWTRNLQQVLAGDYVVTLSAEEAGHYSGTGDYSGPLDLQ